MTGIAIEIDIDNLSMSEGLADLLGKMEHLQPFHANVGEHMLNSIDDRFETETAPDGSKWQHHAPATIASRLRRNGNAPLTILRESGRLAGSFSYDANDDRVEIGTPIIYAAIQHFGGEAGRGHSVTIPPRPILGLSAEDETAIDEMAEDFLRQ